MAPIVAVTRCGLPGAWRALLEPVAGIAEWERHEAPTADQVAALAREADAILTMSQDRIDGALLDRCPSVRVIGQASMGFDNIDVAELGRRGVEATNTPGVLQETTADLTFALILATARRIVGADTFVRAGQWSEVRFDLFLGQEVNGATLGIIGYGRIGRAVARRAHGFGMSVLRYDPFAPADDLSAVVELDELLARADIVSVHSVLTEQTRHLLGADAFRRMKPTAILVNASRGPIVDQEALYDALVGGEIWAAGLDVFESEPLATGAPILSLPNVTVLPHLGSATLATRGKMVEIAARNIAEVLSGRPALSSVFPARAAGPA